MISQLTIFPIPILNDNYVWVIKNKGNQAIIVDPGQALPVLTFLQKNSLNLIAILITHHHWDHTEGLSEIIKTHSVPVYAPIQEKINHTTDFVQDGDSLKVGDFTCRVINVPGHTLGHVGYYLSAEKALFIGDTLFSAGCGKIFEGTAEQMYSSLMKIAALPNDTLIYCAHEYTLNNLRFAELVDPNNADIIEYKKKIIKLREKNLPTLPSLLIDEKKINPFLRCRSHAIIASVEQYANRSLNNPIEVFENLRKWKDDF